MFIVLLVELDSIIVLIALALCCLLYTSLLGKSKPYIIMLFEPHRKDILKSPPRYIFITFHNHLKKLPVACKGDPEKDKHRCQWNREVVHCIN